MKIIAKLFMRFSLILFFSLSMNIFAQATLLGTKTFNEHEVDGLTILENEKTILVKTVLGKIVAYDECIGTICQLLFLKTHEPYLDGFDGVIKYKDEVKTYQTKGIGKHQDGSIPIIEIPGETYTIWNEVRPSRFIGYLRSGAGNRWGGATMVLINTKTLEVIKRDLTWNENKWIPRLR